MEEKKPILKVKVSGPEGGGGAEIALPYDPAEMHPWIEEQWGVGHASELAVEGVSAEGPLAAILADAGIRDLELLNDVAAVAAAMADERLEGAAAYWQALVPAERKGDPAALANVLLAASEGDLPAWEAYSFEDDLGLNASAPSRGQKAARTLFEGEYGTPAIAYFGWSAERYGAFWSDHVALRDDGYLDLDAELPDLRSYDLAAAEADIADMGPGALDDLPADRRATVTARSLRDGREFSYSLPVAPERAEAMHREASLGGQDGYGIVKIADGGVLAALGADAHLHEFAETVRTVNALLTLASALPEERLGAVRAAVSREVSPIFMDFAGAVAMADDIPFHPYEFPGIEDADLARMSREEKWGRTLYARNTGAGDKVLAEAGFDPEGVYEVAGYVLGEHGFLDPDGERIDLGLLDMDALAASAEGARAMLRAASALAAPPAIEDGLTDELAREMAEDAAMGRGEPGPSDWVEPYLAPAAPAETPERARARLNALNDMLHELSPSIVAAEVPARAEAVGAAQVDTPEGGTVWVIFDAAARHPFGPAAEGDFRELDVPVILSAVPGAEPDMVAAAHWGRPLWETAGWVGEQAGAPGERVERAVARAIGPDAFYEAMYRETYQMLGRLKSDCDYFLGDTPARGVAKHLWAHSPEAQIAEMRRLVGELPGDARPEWLTEADIDRYERDMAAAAREAGNAPLFALNARAAELSPGLRFAEVPAPGHMLGLAVVRGADGGRGMVAYDYDARPGTSAADPDAVDWPVVRDAAAGLALAGEVEVAEWRGSVDFYDLLPYAEAPMHIARLLQDAVLEAQAEAYPATPPAPAWARGDVAMDRDTLEAFLVTGVAKDGSPLLGTDLAPADPAHYERVGSIGGEAAARFMSGELSAADRNEAMAAVVAEWRAGLAPEPDEAPAQGAPADPDPQDFGEYDPTAQVGRSALSAAPSVVSDELAALVTGELIRAGVAADGVPAAADMVERAIEAAAAAGESSVSVDLGTGSPFALTFELRNNPHGPGAVAAAPGEKRTYPTDEKTEAPAEPSGAAPEGAFELDPARSGWQEDYPGGWDFLAYDSGPETTGRMGQVHVRPPRATVSIEEVQPGMFVVGMDRAGTGRTVYSDSGYPSLERARDAAMEMLAPWVTNRAELLSMAHGPVAPDPYFEDFERAAAERWREAQAAAGQPAAGEADLAAELAREEAPEPDGLAPAMDMMSEYGFDPSMEYIYIDRSTGIWETAYFNGQGNEGRGQIVTSSGTLQRAMAARPEESGTPLSAVYDRDPDELHDFPDGMEQFLGGFSDGSQIWMAFPADSPHVQANYARGAYELLSRILSEGRSGMSEIVPGEKYRLTAVSVADREQAEAYVSDITLTDAGWRAVTSLGDPESSDVRYSGPYGTFEEARAAALAAMGQGRLFHPRAIEKLAALTEGAGPAAREPQGRGDDERLRFERDLQSVIDGTRSRSDGAVFVCETPGILVAMGMEQRPMMLTASHVRRIMGEKGERRHNHGLGREDLLRLPSLLAHPAVVVEALEGASRQDAIVVVLNAVDADSYPLIAAVRPNGETHYETSIVNTNHILSLYGKDNIEGFLDTAVEQGKVLFVDKKETAELSVQAQLQLLGRTADLPLDRIIRRSDVIDKAEGRENSARQEAPASARRDDRSAERSSPEFAAAAALSAAAVAAAPARPRGPVAAIRAALSGARGGQAAGAPAAPSPVPPQKAPAKVRPDVPGGVRPDAVHAGNVAEAREAAASIKKGGPVPRVPRRQ